MFGLRCSDRSACGFVLVAHPECMVRRFVASENESDRLACANVFGLCWSRNSGPGWNALRSVPH
jgi:hypothetical protein